MLCFVCPRGTNISHTQVVGGQTFFHKRGDKHFLTVGLVGPYWLEVQCKDEGRPVLVVGQVHNGPGPIGWHSNVRMKGDLS